MRALHRLLVLSQVHALEIGIAQAAAGEDEDPHIPVSLGLSDCAVYVKLTRRKVSMALINFSGSRASPGPRNGQLRAHPRRHHHSCVHPGICNQHVQPASLGRAGYPYVGALVPTALAGRSPGRGGEDQHGDGGRDSQHAMGEVHVDEHSPETDIKALKEWLTQKIKSQIIV